MSLKRRTVVSAGIWAAPAIVATAPAPAYAASGTPPRLQVDGKTLFNRPYGGTGVDNLERLVVYTTTPGLGGSSGSAPVDRGFGVAYTTTSNTISDASASFWFASSELSFTTGPGHDTGWSLLSRDGSLPTNTNPSTGIVYYPYTTRYTRPIAAVDRGTPFPAFAFNTPGSVRSLLRDMDYWGDIQFYTFVQAVATIDGKVQERRYGPLGVPR